MPTIEQKQKVYFESVLLEHPGSEHDALVVVKKKDSRVIFAVYSEEANLSAETARLLGEALIVAAHEAEAEHRTSYERLRVMQTCANVVSITKRSAQ